ncbi:MAG TPA: DUF4185 domain-containing protein [Propionicimonas sp.]|uniref:DUF4185 domain-containing protein n=1 Tax=Propionicimonas sp. TaxID=1955623 RepID=UPI002F3FD6EE
MRIDEALIGEGSALVERRFRPRWVDALVLDGSRLGHYRRRLDRPDRPWVRVGTITERATGPGRLRRSGRALIASVPEGDRTTAYQLEPTGWQPAGGTYLHRDAPDGPEAPTAADLGADSSRLRAVATFTASGWDQALTDEDGSVFSYHRRPGGSWERNACLRLHDPDVVVDGPESVKLAQVTGDLDATPTPWGERTPTLSASLSSAGVRGTDLGVRFDHDGRSFLLFGDTHWTRRWLTTRDSIAEITATGPRPGLPGVRFHGSPLKLVGGRATMREYDVPLDAFSTGGELYGFFSSNHSSGRRVMGRSVLARAEDPTLVIDPASRRAPVRFRVLGTFSDRHFINVSTQLVGDDLLIWGSGPYRASEPRLAKLDGEALAKLAQRGTVLPFTLGVRYWDGAGWSDHEEEAAPLLSPGALGELSVRWVPEAGGYLMLAGSGPEDPIGPAITLRVAKDPWGPWSPRLRLLDWIATGMSHHDPFTRFIKAANEGDPVGDRIFPGQADGTGAAYAPYLFDTHLEDRELVLRYTLSTWNPYQVVLMQHRLHWPPVVFDGLA